MYETYLRKADNDDVDLLYRWVNDETVRKNAFRTQKIKYTDHVKWCKEKLNSTDCVIYIYCQDKIPIGQGRIDVIDGNRGMVSYSIDSTYRLRGHGRNLLTLLESAVSTDLPNVKTLIARVKKENISSQRRFEQRGYNKADEDDYYEYIKQIIQE